ncbi:MAG: hypothetical protein AAGE61_08125 [Pseudomonadota bacterium]
MNTKTIITTAVAIALSTGAFAASVNNASAGERVKAKTTGLQLNAKRPGGTQQAHNVPHNHAPAWTAGCYAEFGPDASDPDPKLLQICLDK